MDVSDNSTYQNEKVTRGTQISVYAKSTQRKSMDHKNFRLAKDGQIFFWNSFNNQSHSTVL